MKKIVSLAFVLMLVVAGAAMAGGINSSWDDCFGAGGVQSKVVACTNSATAVQHLYVSFFPDQAIPNNGAVDANVDVQTPNAMGSWWLNYGARYAATNGPSTCEGWWQTAPNGPVMVGPNATQTSASRTRLRIVCAVATGQEQALDPAVEYLSHTIDLKFGAGTANPPTGNECSLGAAFAATRLETQQPGGGTQVLTAPNDDNCAMFRTGGGAATCPGATPTQKSTWGSIKAIYR